MESDAGDAYRTDPPATGGRAEIDTRPPFRSVREAVTLFGEKVLAGEIYANKLKEIRTAKVPVSGRASPSPQFKIQAALTAELERTKQTLSKTLEENTILSQRIKTLKDQLERAEKEIQVLKTKHEPMSSQRMGDPEIEELKFVERRQTIKNRGLNNVDDRQKEEEEEEEIVEEFEKRRLVRFASPPSLTRVMVSGEEDQKENKVLERPPSVKEKDKMVLEKSYPSINKTKKKKSFVSFMGWFVS